MLWRLRESRRGARLGSGSFFLGHCSCSHVFSASPRFFVDPSFPPRHPSPCYPPPALSSSSSSSSSSTFSTVLTVSPAHCTPQLPFPPPVRRDPLNHAVSSFCQSVTGTLLLLSPPCALISSCSLMAVFSRISG